MADAKISALTALTGVNVDTAADVLPIVDTSVTTTKKILVQELWNGIQKSVILAKSGAAINVPADTTEDTLVTITVAANAMGANGRLRITTYWTETNNANVKTTRIKFGGTNHCALASNGISQRGMLATITNRNATNSQWGVGLITGGLLYSDQGYVTSAVDTTSAVTLLITGQKAVSGDTLTLESYLVELISDGT